MDNYWKSLVAPLASHLGHLYEIMKFQVNFPLNLRITVASGTVPRLHIGKTPQFSWKKVSHVECLGVTLEMSREGVPLVFGVRNLLTNVGNWGENYRDNFENKWSLFS